LPEVGAELEVGVVPKKKHEDNKFILVLISAD